MNLTKIKLIIFSLGFLISSCTPPPSVYHQGQYEKLDVYLGSPLSGVAHMDTSGLPSDVKLRYRVYMDRVKGVKQYPATAYEIPTLINEFGYDIIIQREIVGLINAPEIKNRSKDFTSQCVQRFCNDCLLQEAQLAERYLMKYPATALVPYINLFLLHRYGLIYKYLELDKRPNEVTAVQEKYAKYLSRAHRDPDPLVVLFACYIESELADI